MEAVASSKTSWFRRSLVARESAPTVPQLSTVRPISPRASPIQAPTAEAVSKTRPAANKRATWANGVSSNAAPIPILPSIRPVSPLSDAVTAQATVRPAEAEERVSKKIGRQLSVASHGNHYADIHRQEAERALNGQRGPMSPPSSHKESFFSHLRKRARRLSGRYQTPLSPNADDIEANAGCAPWVNYSNRQSMVGEQPPTVVENASQTDFTELDKALRNVRYSLDATTQVSDTAKPTRMSSNPMLKRHHSVPHSQESKSSENVAGMCIHGNGPISSRTRKALQRQSNPANRYETPDEEDELLDEVLASAHKAAKRLDKHALHDSNRSDHQLPTPGPGHHGALSNQMNGLASTSSYLTPSPSANRNEVKFDQQTYVTPIKSFDPVKTQQNNAVDKWPTPPYDDNETSWATSVTASLFATQSGYR
jgi:meiosis induction protein kinase IME2/SME1